MTYAESDESDAAKTEHPIPLGGIGCFGERLKEIMGNTGARAFARTCGLSEGAIRSYLSGETFPTLDRLAQIAHANKLDPMWLAFGGAAKQDEDAYAYVPLYDARCSAGSGAWNERSRVLVNLSFTRYSLRKKGLTPADLACLRVDGDSMLGLLDDGDTVMIDLSRNTLEGEGVYVVMLDDHLYAKRLQRDFDGSVHVISHNREYREIIVPKDRLAELHIIGRVVWAGGWMV
ncbi:XRE family transcriptional regulator [Pseudomonas sp. AOB-7]|uniref:XRE family transcriptional regulator n=1 Tax=Pseudomonas sp. AOB-7 TaxID=2482750 RepID=UPI000EFBF6C6|nr:S24 family peptidase [Pseudomonas sp. AOB-7]RMH86386.1 XRE family transcriptional regulator [Pseudomonas sp. AOB-7]